MGDVSEAGYSSEKQDESQKSELEKLRNKHREEKLAYWKRQREFFFKRARFLDEGSVTENIPEEDITSMAKSLKSKSQVSCELLKGVMNSLNDKDNITAFLKVDGALPALLRVLSGQNEKFQLIAAQCICNLALGTEKESFQVLRASESYLMMHLSGKNIYIKEACIIALGNFSRHGVKHIELLINQGCLPKLINLLKESDENLESSAIYALTQIIYNGCDCLSTEDLENCLMVILPVFKIRSFSVTFLLSVLSSYENGKLCHPHFAINEVHIQALQCLLISLREGEREALYHFRIVSNCMSEPNGQLGKDLIEHHCSVLRECVRYLLQSKKGYLKKECMSLIGNLLNCPVEGFRLFGEDLVKENFELIQLNMREYGAFYKEMICSAGD